MSRETNLRERRSPSNGRHPMSYSVLRRSLLPFVGLLLVVACDDSNGDQTVDSGPSGERVKFDPSDLVDGGADAGGAPGTGGSSKTGTTGGSSALGTIGTNTTKTGELGKACELDSDCKSPLTCHYDSTDYVAHKQCTLPCESSEFCKGTFGEGSFCIGAGVCVRRCALNTDCPSLTQCIDSGWCMRSGPGSGIPTCTGTATPCSLLSSTACLSTLGCTDSSYCSGVSAGCYSMYSSYSCSSQPGCYWSSYDKDCSGYSESCSSQYSSYSCSNVSGCSWRAACTGIPLACSSLSTASCLSQQGCRLVTE
jgi:hypothetical protein